MKCLLSQVTNNPKRDLVLYPIMPEITNILIPSINKTGFWGGLRARPKNNRIELEDGTILETEDEINNYLKTLDAAFDEDGNPLFEIEQAFGHHRTDAAKKCGIEVADFSVTYIADDIMLQMMAEENHRHAANNIAVKLETYRQTAAELKDQANEHEEYEDYLEKYSFFDTQKKWKNARSQKIGAATVQKFLGEDSWPIADVRDGMGVLDKIEDGVCEQTQVIYMPNITIVYQFTRLAENIRKQDYPEYFKELYIDQASKYICDPALGTTVKVLKSAVTTSGKGNLPMDYLMKQKHTQFDLAKEILKVHKAPKEDKDRIPLEDFLEIDGLAGTEGLDEAILKAQEIIDKAAEKEAEKAAKEAGDPVDEDGTADPTPSEEAQAEIDAAAAAAEEAGEAGLPALEDTVPDGEVSVAALAATFAQSAGVFATQVSRLRGKADDLEPDALSAFGTAYENVFESIVQVGLEVYGKQDLLSLIENAEKNL